MHVLGKDLSMNVVKHFMIRFWKFVQLSELFYHNNGYFSMKFHPTQDKEIVLVRGPYSIHNMLMVIKNWSSGFNFKRDMIRTIHVWVKLLNLPFPLWGTSRFGKIGSAIGNPLFTNECIANKMRTSFERILVEIDITKKHKDNISIKDNERNKIKQMIEFEWKPEFYDMCQKVGHQCENEEPKVQKQWKQVQGQK